MHITPVTTSQYIQSHCPYRAVCGYKTTHNKVASVYKMQRFVVLSLVLALAVTCLGEGQTILIESEGGAAEYAGGIMGYFNRTEDMSNGKPVYAQRGGVALLYHQLGNWYIGWAGTRWLKVASENLMPPTTGWLFRVGDEWRTDSTLRLTTSPPDPSSTCNTIQMSATGPAADVQNEKMGRYLWEGEWLSGRKLFKGGRGNEQYLRIRHRGTTWGISPTKDSRVAGIESGRGTTCPCRGAGPSGRLGWDGWRYNDGVKFRVDRSIQVTCE